MPVVVSRAHRKVHFADEVTSEKPWPARAMSIGDWRRLAESTDPDKYNFTLINDPSADGPPPPDPCQPKREARAAMHAEESREAAAATLAAHSSRISPSVVLLDVPAAV